jgi:hypothetical protein
MRLSCLHRVMLVLHGGRMEVIGLIHMELMLYRRWNQRWRRLARSMAPGWMNNLRLLLIRSHRGLRRCKW